MNGIETARLGRTNLRVPRICFGTSALADMPAICARHGVPLRAADLQFSMRDTRIASTICGITRPERIQQTIEWAQWPIPDDAWAELNALPVTTDDPKAARQYLPD